MRIYLRVPVCVCTHIRWLCDRFYAARNQIRTTRIENKNKKMETKKASSILSCELWRERLCLDIMTVAPTFTCHRVFVGCFDCFAVCIHSKKESRNRSKYPHRMCMQNGNGRNTETKNAPKNEANLNLMQRSESIGKVMRNDNFFPFRAHHRHRPSVQSSCSVRR